MVLTLSPTQVSAKYSYITTINTHNTLNLHQFINNSINSRKFRIPTTSNGGTNISIIKAYIENTSPISNFVNKVIGSLPVIGLIARMVNDEGGVAGDIIDFAEFRRRVGNKCSVNDSRAFFEFQERRGRVIFLTCFFMLRLSA